MTQLAIAVVHTTGINWESVLLLIVAIVGSITGAAQFITSRMDRNRAMTERVIVTKAQDIIDSVTDKHLSEYKHIRRRGR